MAHPVLNVTEEQAAAAIADREPYVLVFLLRPSAEAGAAGEGEHAVQGAALSSGKKRKAEGGTHQPGGWTLKEEEAVRQACEATKGRPYEEAYKVYKRATARSMNSFVKRAGLLGYTWPEGFDFNTRKV